MTDKIPVHTDGRLRHRAAAGALQPNVPGAGPDPAMGCDLPGREYPSDKDRCPDCNGHMQHIQHALALPKSRAIHFDHHCLGKCGVRFRDA
jgi:hypothetical protein